MLLTGDAVLLPAVGEHRLQLGETPPGLGPAGEALQVVQVEGRTADRNKAAQTRLPDFSRWKPGTSPLVSVAEVRPEF